MFLNFSNHDSSNWGDKQLEVAQRHGDLIDWTFPSISPEDTYDNVLELAEDYASKILELKPEVVHIMGEMTFTFILINLLKSSGIRCVASTTNRIVEENKEGKVSKFEFVQFRPYY